MAKIPVGATIARAFRFAFGDFVKILGVVWLPSAITITGGILLRPQAMALSAAIATHDFSAMAHLLPLLLPFYALSIVLLFMQVTGITQLALGLRQGAPYYYFSLGKPLWRLIGAFLLILVIMIAGWLIALMAGLGMGAALGFLVTAAHLPPVARPVLLIGAFVVLYCAFIYAFVRLAYLLIPVVIAEERISLRRAWALGRGNFWRMFAIGLAVLIPIIVLEAALVFGLLYHGLSIVPQAGLTPDQLAAARLAAAARNAAVTERMVRYWYIVYPVFGLVSVLFYGLACGAQSFAYRAASETETYAASRPNPL